MNSHPILDTLVLEMSMSGNVCKQQNKWQADFFGNLFEVISAMKIDFCYITLLGYGQIVYQMPYKS